MVQDLMLMRVTSWVVMSSKTFQIYSVLLTYNPVSDREMEGSSPKDRNQTIRI